VVQHITNINDIITMATYYTYRCSCSGYEHVGNKAGFDGIMAGLVVDFKCDHCKEIVSVSVRAKEIAARIEQNCIAHMRMQIIAYFVTTYMPIDIIRKYKKLLSRYLEMSYLSLAERLGGIQILRLIRID